MDPDFADDSLPQHLPDAVAYHQEDISADQFAIRVVHYKVAV